MNRFLTLSLMFHGLLIGGLAVWGTATLDRGALEMVRVRILDERAGSAPGTEPESQESPDEAAPPEQGVARTPPAPVRAAAGRRAPPPPATRAPAVPRGREEPASRGAAPPVPATSLPSGVGRDDRDGAAAERDARIAEIHARIQAALLYPREARRRGLEGTVRLRFAMREDGRVHRVAVRESSGERLLDHASIRTVRRAQPFPFVQGDLEVPVVFRLK